jgi:hypothetical protein
MQCPSLRTHNNFYSVIVSLIQQTVLTQPVRTYESWDTHNSYVCKFCLESFFWSTCRKKIVLMHTCRCTYLHSHPCVCLCVCMHAHMFCLLDFIKLLGASLLELSLLIWQHQEFEEIIYQLGDMSKSMLVGTHFYLNLTCIYTLICSSMWSMIGMCSTYKCFCGLYFTATFLHPYILYSRNILVFFYGEGLIVHTRL